MHSFVEFESDVSGGLVNCDSGCMSFGLAYKHVLATTKACNAATYVGPKIVVLFIPIIIYTPRNRNKFVYSKGRSF